jgi:hypothetical protein
MARALTSLKSALCQGEFDVAFADLQLVGWNR